MRAGGGVQLVGTRQGDINNSFHVPGYATMDGFASWQLQHLMGQWTKLPVNGINQLNQGYTLTPTGSAYRNTYGTEKTVLIALEAGF